MARTALTVQTPKGPYPGTVAAEALDFTWAAGDDVNDNDFVFTGRELILCRNDDAAAQTIGFVSVADAQKRLGDITAYSVGIGEYAAFWAGNVLGWSQTGGKFHIDVSDPDLKFAIIRIP